MKASSCVLVSTTHQRVQRKILSHFITKTNIFRVLQFTIFDCLELLTRLLNQNASFSSNSTTIASKVAFVNYIQLNIM